MARTTTEQQITVNALNSPTSFTNRSNLSPITPGKSLTADDSSEAPPNRIRKKGTTLRKVKSESTAPNAFKSALARRFQRYDLSSGNNTLSLFNFY